MDYRELSDRWDRLSDYERIDAVAIDVMGWVIETDYVNDIAFWFCPHSGIRREHGSWQPLTDMNAANMSERHAACLCCNPVAYLRILTYVIVGDVVACGRIDNLIHATPAQRCKAAWIAVMIARASRSATGLEFAP